MQSCIDFFSIYFVRNFPFLHLWGTDTKSETVERGGGRWVARMFTRLTGVCYSEHL